MNNINTQIKTQVLVLGSGPGGYSAAFRCADLGMDTIIIERYSKLGGVCLNVGCIPSKALLYISDLINTNNNLNKYGIFSNQIHFNINKISDWKNKIIAQSSYNLKNMAKKRNIKIINGLGKFINSHTLQIYNNNQHIVAEILFEYAIIAAGSRSTLLPSMTIHDKRIWNSTDALKLKTIPKRLLIVGSGAIGLEMATIYHSLGSTVSIIETRDQIIPELDKDIKEPFIKIITKKIHLSLNTKITKINPKIDGIHVDIVQNKKNLHLSNTEIYDALLIAIGRTPNSDIINLDQTGVITNSHGFISVDKQMRTNITHIFAIGDIVGHPMLAHKSIHEGHIAAEVISGKQHYFDPKIIPSVIYTNPEIAWVGVTEPYAQNKNIDYETALFPWSASGKAIASNCTEGITKLIFDKKTRKIIGGTVLGTHASEILGEISLAIEMGCDVEDITLTIHAHPTLYESIKSAASIYNGSITDLLNLKN